VDAASTPRVLVYRDLLLPRSETFILSQGEALRRFEAYYAGSRMTVNGLSVPKGRTLVINRGGFSGRAGEVVFKSLGIAPGFFRNARAIKPSLIHAHFGMDGVLALPLARALAVPLIVTFHGVDATMSDEYLRRSDYPHRRYLSHRRALQRDAHLFLAVSHFIASALMALTAAKQRLFYNTHEFVN